VLTEYRSLYPVMAGGVHPRLDDVMQDGFAFAVHYLIACTGDTLR
jgi:hypothetical protein